MPDLAAATSSLLEIILANLVLSGDNALVIGMVVQRLHGPNRRRAIVAGTVGAVLLRVLFTLIASYLLDIPLLSAAGGVALFWIGYKLIAEAEEGPQVSEVKTGLLAAIATIMVADAVMSLDNALAVAAAAGGDRVLLIVGLALSIPLLMAGAGVVSYLFERLPWLLAVGAAVIAFTGAELIHDDPYLHQRVAAFHQSWTLWVLGAIAVFMTLYLGMRARAATREVEEVGA